MFYPLGFLSLVVCVTLSAAEPSGMPMGATDLVPSSELKAQQSLSLEAAFREATRDSVYKKLPSIQYHDATIWSEDSAFNLYDAPGNTLEARVQALEASHAKLQARIKAMEAKTCSCQVSE